MNKRIKLLKEAIRLILEESQTSQEKIVIHSSETESGGELRAVAYDSNYITQKLEELKEDPERLAREYPNIVYDSIKGMVDINPYWYRDSKQNCHKAAEIERSAGPGYGKLVYDMAYFMSQQTNGSGLVIPDRDSLTDDAINFWKGASKRSKGKPLDNFNHPDPEKDPFHAANHTDDDSDDCKTWDVGSQGANIPDQQTADLLNHAYYNPSGQYDIQKMIEEDWNFIKYVEKNFGIKERNFGITIEEMAFKFFKSHTS